MPGYTITLKADGTRQTAAHEDFPSLGYLQRAVGGYIELIPLFEKFLDGGQMVPCVAYCNEDGKVNGLCLNRLATLLWFSAAGRPLGDFLVGDVVIVYGDEEFMRKG